MAKQKTLRISTKPHPKQKMNIILLSYGLSTGRIEAGAADFAELIEGFRNGFEDVQITEAGDDESDELDDDDD